MAARTASTKTQAWKFFDRIVERASRGGSYSNPWHTTENSQVEYLPDFRTLSLLLGVPLYLSAPITTGVPALALDVWIAYELRRAGFSPDSVWPRDAAPRVLPGPVAALLESLPHHERRELTKRIVSGSPTGVAPSQALILGKNYRKQVDVVMSHWSTGPELLVSTKRMDSSFAKNAQNRIEEAYGDAKNLRLRHPMAGLGFLFGIRSTAFTDEPRSAEFIADLLMKLAQEEDAYNVTCMLPIEYSSDAAPAPTGPDAPAIHIVEDAPADDPKPLALFPESTENSSEAHVPERVMWQDSLAFGDDGQVDEVLADLPGVGIREDLVPPELRSGQFFDRLVRHVLAATPTTLHETARDRLKVAQYGS